MFFLFVLAWVTSQISPNLPLPVRHRHCASDIVGWQARDDARPGFRWLVSRELFCSHAGWQFCRGSKRHSSMASFVKTSSIKRCVREPCLRKQQQLCVCGGGGVCLWWSCKACTGSGEAWWMERRLEMRVKRRNSQRSCSKHWAERWRPQLFTLSYVAFWGCKYTAVNSLFV